MMSLKNFKEHMPRQLLIAAQQYLKEGHTIRIFENDQGCYDAVIQEANNEHWVEVTLEKGSYNIIEDCYCSKCNSPSCVHTVAVLQLINENKEAFAEGHLKASFR